VGFIFVETPLYILWNSISNSGIKNSLKLSRRSEEVAKKKPSV